ncbi:MAG: hypothetical protein WD069_10610 [Planctomycetales bacterium]
MSGRSATSSTRVRRGLSVAATVTLAFAIEAAASTARAANWMFEPSYYSHELPPEVAAEHPRPISRSAYRRAWAATQPGFAIRGAWRYNRVQIRSGSSTDTLIIREDWFNERP